MEDQKTLKNGNKKRKGRAGRRKAKRRLRILLAFDFVMLIAVAALLVFTVTQTKLVLNGDPEMEITVGSEFNDPGVQSKNAVTSGTVDTSKPGTYTIEYSWLGKKVTRTVHVIDPDRIVLGLKGSKVQIVKQGEPYIEGGAYAIDGTNGPLPEDSISITGSVDTSVPGDYTVHYEVSDGDAVSKADRTVRVVTEEEFGPSADLVPVMMYHWVYTADDVPEDLDANWILDTDLEEQLKFLKENNYYYPSWKELNAWIAGEISLPNKCIIMTFDDGKKAFLEYGVPLLEKYEVPATSFMICWEKNKAVSKITKYASPYVSFESHSYAMHQPGGVSGYKGIIAAMSKDEILEDLKAANKIVINNDAFAYPYGDYTEASVEALKEQGILCAFTTEYGMVSRGMDPYRLPRIRVLGNRGLDTWKASIYE